MSNFTFTFHFHALEKEMATHSSVLAWRIPRMGEPGGLPSTGSHRVGQDWRDLTAAVLAEGMATYSSILACRIPWTEETGRLQFMGLQRARHDWSDLVHSHVQCIYVYWENRIDRHYLKRKALCEDLFCWLLKYNKIIGMKIALHWWKDRQIDQFNSEQKQTQKCIDYFL